jgi:hypothetical protein
MKIRIQANSKLKKIVLKVLNSLKEDVVEPSRSLGWITYFRVSTL